MFSTTVESVDALASPHPQALLASWTPNTGLMDMPTELLREIFLDIPSEFLRTLYNLSLTCRRFRDVIAEYLEPEHNLRGHTVEDSFALAQQLGERPSSRGIIRSIRLSSNAFSWHKRTQQELDELLRRTDLQSLIDTTPGSSMLAPFRPEALRSSPVLLLSLLPRLEALEMRSDGSERSDHARMLLYYVLIYILSGQSPLSNGRFHGFKNLIKLNLLFTKCDYVSLFGDTIFQLPSLQKVVLSHVHFGPTRVWKGKEHSSSVIALHIRDLFPKDVPGACVTRSFNCLKVLRLDFHPFPVEVSTTPASLASVLASQKHSLESIELYTNEMYATYDGSPIETRERRRDYPYWVYSMPYWDPLPSFKDFERLKCLALTDWFLVGTSPQGLTYWRDPVANTVNYPSEMFPHSLEIFTHIIRDGPNGYDALLSDDEKHLRSWDHVWETATREQFPNMERVETVSYGLKGLMEDRRLIRKMEE